MHADNYRQSYCFFEKGAVAHGTAAGQAPFFGRGSGMIILDDINCIGNESNLLECATLSDCDHNEDAGVTCQSRGRRIATHLLSSQSLNITYFFRSPSGVGA